VIEAYAIQKDSFRIVNAELFWEQCRSLAPGQYSVKVEKKRKKKSNAQLAWLYGQIYPHVLRGLIDVGYDEFTNLDQIDAKCKEMFARQEIINKHTGEIMSIPALKREMTTIEFSTYVQVIREWASDYLGVTIPDPETNLTMNL